MTMYTGDYEHGQVIRLQFPTRARATGELTNIFQSNAGGTPTYEIRERLTGNAVVNAPPSLTLNKTTGMHEMAWDTAASSDAVINKDYDFYIVDGRVSADGTTDNWVNVSGESVLSFALQNSSPGFVLQRSVKVQTFTVASVVNDSVFVISGTNLNTAADAYELQNLAWAPGAANFGSGYVARSSSDEGGGQVRITMQRPFTITPVVGDGGYILPEERPAEQYWCNIECEWLPQDKYVCTWYNGTRAKAAEDTPKITVVRTSDGAVVVPSRDMSIVPNSDPVAYEYVESTVLVPANDIAQVTITATIDSSLRIYARNYPHTA